MDPLAGDGREASVDEPATGGTGVGSQRDRQRGDWRARWRFLLATLALTLAYLAIQDAWLWVAERLGRSGWTWDDPAQTYAGQAAELARTSAAREAKLSPRHIRAVLELGAQYGYLSEWLGGYGAQPEATLRQLARPVQRNLDVLHALATFLGVGPVVPLPVRTAGDFGQLTQRLESDAGGVAARVEQATSPRLRHLFMLGVHVGVELAALESAGKLMPTPAAGPIGMHATLAGVPQSLWRPLARLDGDDAASVYKSYRAAAVALEQAYPDTP